LRAGPGGLGQQRFEAYEMGSDSGGSIPTLGIT